MYFGCGKVLLSGLVSLQLLAIQACTREGDGTGKDTGIKEEEILSRVGAVKTLNEYDEEACNVYLVQPGANSPDARIARSVELNDKKDGKGAFRLAYEFAGKSMNAAPETVLLEETWADYRPDFSFHPLGISIWVKGETGNDDIFRLLLVQDETLEAPREQRALFQYTDEKVLGNNGWQRLVIPFSAFRLQKGVTGADTLHLSRVTGYRIEILNKSGRPHSGKCLVDRLEQLTSFKPAYGRPVFSSLFIQLADVYKTENWDADFKACREVGIDTWIVQYSHGFGAQNEVSWYSGTKAPWTTTTYPIVDSMMAAAERQQFKLILGLYGGDYTNVTDPADYDHLYERNRLVLDELYERFAGSPAFAGWYITEEFHDGSYPDGRWQKDPARTLLADYLQRVAAYAKSKPKKFPVQIAPALFRGMPADKCGEWFRSIFSRTPDIDFLYLQDIGGRCLVDVDVDLPNWFAEIKKACDETGVAFGVDIESFRDCWCPKVPYHAKPWEELQEQLQVAGLFTTHLTNFSWATFKPGTPAFEGYKAYVKSAGK